MIRKLKLEVRNNKETRNGNMKLISVQPTGFSNNQGYICLGLQLADVVEAESKHAPHFPYAISRLAHIDHVC